MKEFDSGLGYQTAMAERRHSFAWIDMVRDVELRPAGSRWLKPMASSRSVARNSNGYRGIAGGTQEERGMRMGGIEGIKWCSSGC